MNAQDAIVGNKYEITGGINGEIGSVLTLTDKYHTGGDFRDQWGEEVYKQFANVEPLKTPAQKLGYKVGDKFEIVSGRGRAGSIITMLEDDGSDLPYFTDEEGKRICKNIDWIKPYVAPKLTPMEAAGYKIGDKFRMTRESNFNKDEIIVFTEDDSTTIPYFTPADGGGRQRCEGMANIEPYVEPEQTPAQEAGYQVGDKFTVEGEDGVFVLSEDDNTSCPYFRDEDGALRCFNLEELTPFVAPEPKLTVGTAFVKEATGWTVTTDVDLSFESRQAIRAIIDQQVFGTVAPVEEVAEAEPEVVAEPARKEAYRIIDNNNMHEFDIGDIVYKVEGTEYNYGSNKQGSGMSKDPDAKVQPPSGNVRYSDMEKVQAFRIVANDAGHSFAIGDIVYKANCYQRGADKPRPFFGMSKNPAATERDYSGEVFTTDMVAL